MRSLKALLCAMTIAAPASAAKPTPAQCIAAADDGQQLRDEGKLLSAREKFVECSSSECSSAIAKECTAWLDQVEQMTPTIAFRAKDGAGRELVDVRVVVDGKVIAESIDARATKMDPGKYAIRFERAGASVEDTIVLRAGERNRIIELAFGTIEAPPRETPAPRSTEGSSFRVPWVAWVGLGLAVVGGVGTATFAVLAKDDENRLRKTCAPVCPPSERGGVDTKLALANVSLAVGIVGLTGAVAATIIANVTRRSSGVVVSPGLASISIEGWF